MSSPISSSRSLCGIIHRTIPVSINPGDYYIVLFKHAENNPGISSGFFMAEIPVNFSGNRDISRNR